MIRLAPTLGLGTGFAASAALSAGTQFLALPFLLAGLGAAGWSSLVLGTSLGTIAALGGGWGWPLIGAPAVAAAPLAQRPALWAQSLRSRTWPVLISLVLLIIAMAAISSPDPTATGISAGTAFVSGALGSPWYYVGSQEPARMLTAVTMPLVAGTITSAALASLTGIAWHSALATLAAAAVAATLTTVDIDRRRRAYPSAPPPPVSGLREATGVGFIAAVYVNVPLVLVAQHFPAALPVYALADRLYRVAHAAVTPLIQLLQGKIPSPDPRETARRVWAAVPLLGGMGLALGLAFAVVVPSASRIYTGGLLEVPAGLAVAFGLALCAWTVNGVTGAAGLAVIGEAHWMLLSVVAGAMVGTVALFISIKLLAGIVAVGLAAALSEIVVSATQVLRLRTLRGRHRAI